MKLKKILSLAAALALSSKSRFLTCLIGNKEVLRMQCWGIRPHLSARGKSHGFSRGAAGTWGTFSS